MKKCALIGMGLLGTQHAERLNNYKNTKVVSVCDINIKKAEIWASSKNIPVYSDFRKMLDNEKIDLLVVATQDPYHKDPLVDACKRQIPYIICEKPLCTTLEDSHEIIEAAKNSKSKIKVLFPNRFYPLDRSIRYLLQKDFIGEPEYGEFRIDDSIDVPLKLWGEDSKYYASISSPAHFLLSHAVDLLFFMFDRRVVKVSAVGKSSIIGSDVDYMDCILTFEDGFIVRLKTEWTKRINRLCENYLQFTAKKGGFIFNKTGGFQVEQGLSFVIDAGEEKANEAKTLLEDLGYTASVERCGESGGYAVVMRECENNNSFDWNHGICLYADSFDKLDNKDFPITSLEGGIEQVIVVNALLRSLKEGHEIIL